MKRGFKQVPGMESLSQRLKSCLQEGDPIPADFSKLFDCNLFAFDTEPCSCTSVYASSMSLCA